MGSLLFPSLSFQDIYYYKYTTAGPCKDLTTYKVRMRYVMMDVLFAGMPKKKKLYGTWQNFLAFIDYIATKWINVPERVKYGILYVWERGGMRVCVLEYVSF